MTKIAKYYAKILRFFRFLCFVQFEAGCFVQNHNAFARNKRRSSWLIKKRFFLTACLILN